MERAAPCLGLKRSWMGFRGESTRRMSSRTPAQGDVLAYERSFSVDEVRAFAAVSGDRGVHHVDLDARGRLLVHGLLTATIPTKLGGDVDYLAQEMTYRFHRPVFTGD